MAGSYPDPFGQRIEWDRDGSAAIVWSVTPADMTQGLKNILNGESSTGDQSRLFPQGGYYAVIFPQMTTINALMFATMTSQGGTFSIHYSLNTTNGVDGTWTVLRGGTGMSPQTIQTLYRQPTAPYYFASAPLPLSVKAIKWTLDNITGNTRAGIMHFYGYRTPATGDWLTMWHPTLDQPLSTTPAISDLGDQARGGTAAGFSFRLKNMSATLTAQGITLSREALTDGSPTIVSMMTLQHNGTGYSTTASVGNLAPGAISAVCDARVTVSTTAPIGIWAPRINAIATTWV